MNEDQYLQENENEISARRQFSRRDFLKISGGINMGLSAALSEEIEFSGGTIRTENFDSYQITRFSDATPIDVVLIDNPALLPQGCGEPGITTVGAALANAIFDAVGARVYTLPMTPDRILAAMDS
jgi:nicotinate dehydrogenase subunit B